jgi:hypothetical protein
MASSKVFEWLCDELEGATSFDRLEARGTVRLALKDAGLDASSVDSNQMKVVLEKVLPGELSRRGIDNAEALCSRLAAAASSVDDGGAAASSPEAVFARLGG